MDLYLVWQKRRKWGQIVAILVSLSAYVYLTKTSQSATYSVGNRSAIFAMSPADEGELSLLTYNVAGLPDFISAAELPRSNSMREISQKLNSYDIVNVQEDFHYHKELYTGGDRHPYRTLHKESIPYGDGLNTLSRFPILETERIAWHDCHGADCLAAKGFSYSRILLAKDVTIDVYNVHATAEDNPKSAYARRKNMKQLADYIAQHSKYNALLVMGDFNAHYAATWDNVLQFADKMKLKDAWVILQKQGKRPENTPSFVAQDNLTLTDSCESIDKIFFRNNSQIAFIPRTYNVEKQCFSTNSGTPLSDHCAVSLLLSWKKIKDI